MTEDDYKAVSALVFSKAGIVLGENKQYLVESRLAPLAKSQGFASVSDLVRELPKDAALREAVVDAMTTNETFFFRDKTPFTLFEEVILPALTKARQTTRRVRIWSAACSTGQEAYSLAMVLLAKKPLWAGIEIEIVGTDISPSALQKARDGLYSQFEVQRGLPITLLVEHFSQEGTSWRISDKIRKMVRFEAGNLLDPVGHLGLFDLVMCRNVLIYFDLPTKTDILDRLARSLRPDGYLMLGAAETLLGVTRAFAPSPGHRGLYQPAPVQQKLTA